MKTEAEMQFGILSVFTTKTNWKEYQTHQQIFKTYLSEFFLWACHMSMVAIPQSLSIVKNF